MKNRLKIIQVYNSILIHNLGSPSIHNLLRIKFTAINHSPLRRYYKYRNMIIVYQRYLLLDVLSFLSDMKYCLVELITIFLFEEEKYIKMRYIITGISHGLQGKAGKYQR
jgi:rhamnosyltransferase